MKKYISIIIIVILAAFLLSGCTVHCEAENNIETVRFIGYLKNDKNAPFGKKTAVYDGRIYYHDEGGIYSMTKSGEDIRKEAETNDIRKLQITDDAMYYAEFTKMTENCNGRIRGFDMIKLDESGKTNLTEKVINERISKYGSDDWWDNVWDFYVSQDGRILTSYLDGVDYGSGLYYGIVAEDLKYKDVSSTVDFRGGKCRVAFSAFDELVIGDDLVYEKHFEENKGNGVVASYDELNISTADNTVFDIKRGCQVLTHLETASSDMCFDLYDAKEDGYIFAKENIIFEMTPDFKAIQQIEVLDTDKIITHYLDCGDYAYFVMEDRNKSFFESMFGAEDRSYSQSIYVLNKETFYVHRMLDFDTCIFTAFEEKIVALDKNRLYTVQGSKLTKYLLKDGRAEKHEEIDLGMIVDGKACKAEKAGNHIFFYEYDSNLKTDKLICKIRVI